MHSCCPMSDAGSPGEASTGFSKPVLVKIAIVLPHPEIPSARPRPTHDILTINLPALAEQSLCPTLQHVLAGKCTMAAQLF